MLKQKILFCEGVLKYPEFLFPEFQSPELQYPEFLFPELQFPELQYPEFKSPELQAFNTSSHSIS